MRLGLSSAAAPEASLGELLEAAARRGLRGLELREGDAHGVDPMRLLLAAGTPDEAAARSVEITGYRVTSPLDPRRLARLGELLRATILVDAPCDRDIRISRALGVASEGGSVALVVRGPEVMEDARAGCSAGLDLAWDAHPETGALGWMAAALLGEFGDRLRHIRLYGAGPETELHHGSGIGEMMGRLALAGYSGTVILTPTSTRYRVAWRTWLGRQGGWGCGSKVADPTLVSLGSTGFWKGEAR